MFAAKMASERCSYVGSRRRNGTLVAAPLVVKSGSLDHKSRCAEAALEGIRSNERLLHRMQPIGGDAFDGRHLTVARCFRGHGSRKPRQDRFSSSGSLAMLAAIAVLRRGF
jgi:hypothetical protein